MVMDNPTQNFHFNIPFLGNSHKPTHRNELRIPFLGFLPNKTRNHFIAMVGEFIGTFLFLFFAFSATQVANAAAAGVQDGTTGTAGTKNGISQVPNASTLMYISLAFGFSLAVNAWVFFRISGGLFNPAVTLGMALIGAVTWRRAGLIFISQVLGSIAASGIVAALFPGPLNVTTTLNSTTSITRGLFIEMFLTVELVFTIFMLAAEKHKATFIAPIGIGLALFIAELTGVYFTGGAVNPTRAFGPCVVLGSFPGYHWIYWLGPLLGCLVAVGFYHFVKTLEYETANPGQDFNEHEADAFSFDEENAATGADVNRPGLMARNSMPPNSIGQENSTGHNTLSKNRSNEPKPVVGAYGDGDTVQESNKVVSGGMEVVQPGEKTNGTPKPSRQSRVDGAISEEDEESLEGERSYERGPDAESGMMHPGFGGEKERQD
ncbi:uncharacterized protein MYCGRDRAFT_77797 [Zymoseptoria tritici IPO323]|uniref:Aquaporin-like protein n=2 Tax=Zymoseptoria tritici TaxID=1047171 RepID=F9XQ00_ZYMTI|nr:uncharacterized protein MYCGRDRAFT_77797 [Zymoseptoria tritici IPO323]EGP82554.1 hypothetical protein MYCGRDRAFT_77797 [Zymoseptoria tritici IPO323]